MGENTNISWADSTLNIWFSCTKVSTGPKGACTNCYAQHLVETRFGLAAWGPYAERVEAKGWRAQLRKISRLAKAAGRPWFVFVNSLSDFWDNQADPELRFEALLEFRRHPHVTFLLLTKRPQNIVRLYRAAMGISSAPTVEWALPRNVAIGCTVVTQTEADRDIPHLLTAKAVLKPAFAFVSMEPLMEAVRLDRLWRGLRGGKETAFDALAGRELVGMPSLEPACRDLPSDRPALDWVIVGGETDQGAHKARPSNPQWFRDLRDQCSAAGVPFHLKQNGEWVSVSEVEGFVGNPIHEFPDGRCVRRIGKKAAGRTLDGVVHDARPQLAAERAQ